MKQAGGVEAAPAGSSANLVDATDAIGAHHFLALAIPQEQVLVVLVEGIEVARAAGALARRAERELAQPADFFEQVRDRTGLGAVHRVVAGIDEQLADAGRRATSPAKSAGAPQCASGCTRRGSAILRQRRVRGRGERASR